MESPVAFKKVRPLPGQGPRTASLRPFDAGESAATGRPLIVIGHPAIVKRQTSDSLADHPGAIRMNFNWSELRPRVERRVRQRLHADSSGHDWWHIDRVRRTALYLAVRERADPVVVELAALLHDVADWKLTGGNIDAGRDELSQWMDDWQIPAAMQAHVLRIIDELSFKGAGVPTPMSSKEGRVVQDADRLDAIGAIGIGRAFAFGGARGRAMHDPAEEPELHDSFESYQSKSGATINHFHEKLLLLRDRMNTATARRIADERHEFMQRFLSQFMTEWDFPTTATEGPC
jgi:uncharacterized protein